MSSVDEVEMARDIFIAEFDSPNVLGLGLGIETMHNEEDNKDWLLIAILLEDDPDLPDYIEQVEVRYILSSMFAPDATPE